MKTSTLISLEMSAMENQALFFGEYISQLVFYAQSTSAVTSGQCFLGKASNQRVRLPSYLCFQMPNSICSKQNSQLAGCIYISKLCLQISSLNTSEHHIRILVLLLPMVNCHCHNICHYIQLPSFFSKHQMYLKRKQEITALMRDLQNML